MLAFVVHLLAFVVHFASSRCLLALFGFVAQLLFDCCFLVASAALADRSSERMGDRGRGDVCLKSFVASNRSWRGRVVLRREPAVTGCDGTG